MNALRAALVAVAVAFGVWAVAGPPRAAFPLTTYAASSDAALWLDLTAGLALLGAGLLAAMLAPLAVAGATVLAGVAWFGPDFLGWDGGPELARSLGAVVAPFLLPAIAHIGLAMPAGRLRARAPVAALYGAATVVALARALFHEPFADPDCWAACGGNVLLVSSEQGIVDAIEDAWLVLTIGVGVGLAAGWAWSLARASRVGRRARLPLLGPAVAAVLAQALYAAVLLAEPAESPGRDGFAAIFLARAAAVAGLAAGLAWTVANAHRTRLALARLGAELGTAPRPGTLRTALARALGDPDLEVAYAVAGRHLDAEGMPVELPEAGDGRARTAIAREGEVLAVVVHDPGLLDSEALEREVGSAARLAVDNERLQAELLARLREVRASRARLVEAGDAERRRLERDLHDGAQQRLLAASYELRVACTEAADLAPLLEAAAGQAQAANEELRRLAHGIFPAVLAEAGLAAALDSLADTAPLPLELGPMTSERFAPAVESAAYAAVAEAVEDANRRGASYVSVGAVSHAGVLRVEVADDGAAANGGPVHIADRVGALGGRLETGPGLLRVVLPCG